MALDVGISVEVVIAEVPLRGLGQGRAQTTGAIRASGWHSSGFRCVLPRSDDYHFDGNRHGSLRSLVKLKSSRVPLSDCYEVLEPAEFRETIADFLSRAAEQYRK